jgi:hypothetical protein
VDSVIAPLSYNEDTPVPALDACTIPLDVLAADPDTRRTVADLVGRGADASPIQQAFNSSI